MKVHATMVIYWMACFALVTLILEKKMHAKATPVVQSHWMTNLLAWSVGDIAVQVRSTPVSIQTWHFINHGQLKSWTKTDSCDLDHVIWIMWSGSKVLINKNAQYWCVQYWKGLNGIYIGLVYFLSFLLSSVPSWITVISSTVRQTAIISVTIEILNEIFRLSI